MNRKPSYRRYQEFDETTGGLPSKTLWMIIAINALVSIVVSLIVVLFVGPWVWSGTGSNLSVQPDNPKQAGASSQRVPTSLSPDATSTPALPTPTTPVEPQEYVIQVGDSLSAIAERFNVSQEDIMLTNNIDNPNQIQAGQTIYIPSGGLAQATPTFTPIPLPSATPIPFEPPSQANGSPSPAPTDISLTPTPTVTPIPTATAPPLGEIALEITSVLGYGELEQEAVTISNNGPGVNLYGWKLTGSALGDYNFPNLFLWNGGNVTIHTTTGTGNFADLYWGQDKPAWFSGDTVALKDAQGETIATYTIP